MFKDKEEALRRLEAELLQEEEEETPDGEYEEDEEYGEEDYEEDYEEDDYEADEEDSDGEYWEEEEPVRQMPRGMAARVKAYNTDALEADLDEYSRKVYKARSRGRWIAAVALILLASVLLVLAFFAARYGR